MAYIPYIRLFLSSPSDVVDERKIAMEVIERLPYRAAFLEKATIRVIAWDKPGVGTALRAKLTPQEAINRCLPKPSECDIVVVIFWSQLGTPFKDADGKNYLSGTHWELINALDSDRPEVVIYRRMEDPDIRPSDPKRDKKLKQYDLLQEFFRSEIFFKEGQILRGVNTYTTTEDFRSQFEGHLEELVIEYLQKLESKNSPDIFPEEEVENENIITIQAEDWPVGKSPFPGLRAFTEEDAPIFFGRGHETDLLIKKIANHRFVAVVGSSGSGKSSLVAAGLLPRLRANAISNEYTSSGNWHIVHFTPADNPFESLAAALIEHIPSLMCEDSIDYPERLDKLTKRLEKHPDRLSKILRHALKDDSSFTEVLLFIDQFEELLTLSPKITLKPFTEMLMSESDRIRVVITMRADFFHKALPFLEIPLRDGTFPLDIPGPGALYEMIIRPAERAFLAFEKDLPERILIDTGENPGSLALMAYLLDELYQSCYGSGLLTNKAYEKLGRVQGAIGKRAEDVFNRLNDDTKSALPLVFRELVSLDERGIPTRKRASLNKIAQNEPARHLIDELTRARLLVQNRGQDDAIVELAHEALFRSWPHLSQWIAKTRDDLYLLNQVERAAKEWDIKSRPEFLLWPNERLKLVYEMQQRIQPNLDPVILDFIIPEQNRLLRELEDLDTPHARRSYIGERLAAIGDTRKGVGLNENGLPDIEWCYIDRSSQIRPFYISKYLITYSQFQKFLDAPDGFEQEEWWDDFDGRYSMQSMAEQNHKFSNYPRDNVSWYQAVAFCKWLTNKLYKFINLLPQNTSDEWIIRLPTKEEWQMAASGGLSKNYYPWGTAWDSRLANTIEAGIGRTTAVGMYPLGKSPTSLMDIAGNVWEWCSSTQLNQITGHYNTVDRQILCGGSYLSSKEEAKCNSILKNYAYYRGGHYGFRTVLAQQK